MVRDDKRGAARRSLLPAIALVPMLIGSALAQAPVPGGPGGFPGGGMPGGGMPGGGGAAPGKAPGKARAQTVSDKAVQKAIDMKNARELGAKRFGRAASMLQKILKNDPTSGNAHRVMAWVLVAQGKRTAAKAEFEQAKANMQEDDNNWNDVNEALARVTASIPVAAPGEPGKASPDGGAAPGAPAAPEAGGTPMPGGPPPDAGMPLPGGAGPGEPAPPDAGGMPSPGGPSPGGPGAPEAGGMPSPGGPGGPATPPGGGPAPPPAEGGGSGLPIPLIGGGLGGLLLIVVLVKKFVIDKKAAGG